MAVGVVFPQTEIGPDAGAIRQYAETVEALGFTHLMIYDHVLGADRVVHKGWSGYYDSMTSFHEPMVLFGYLAGLVSLDLLTGILILPQRQTALVAKQAAEIDILSRGRLRLGVGLGWNEVEYEALGKTFGDRGLRIEEQIAVLRRLWTEPSIIHEGIYERLHGVALCPLPIQRPIPLWIGGESLPAYRRAGRLADGWIPDHLSPGPDLDKAKTVIHDAARAAGRDPSAIGMQGRIRWGDGGGARLSAGELPRLVADWQHAGASHVALNTMDAGLGSIEGHLAVLRAAAEVLELDKGQGRVEV
ncbi:MAG: LLM class F420-dependent oxidoreductase [Acidimicrobiales bacterium]